MNEEVECRGLFSRERTHKWFFLWACPTQAFASKYFSFSAKWDFTETDAVSSTQQASVQFLIAISPRPPGPSYALAAAPGPRRARYLGILEISILGSISILEKANHFRPRSLSDAPM